MTTRMSQRQESAFHRRSIAAAWSLPVFEPCGDAHDKQDYNNADDEYRPIGALVLTGGDRDDECVPVHGRQHNVRLGTASVTYRRASRDLSHVFTTDPVIGATAVTASRAYERLPTARDEPAASKREHQCGAGQGADECVVVEYQNRRRPDPDRNWKEPVPPLFHDHRLPASALLTHVPARRKARHCGITGCMRPRRSHRPGVTAIRAHAALMVSSPQRRNSTTRPSGAGATCTSVSSA